MDEEIIEALFWTDSARFSFNNIVDYLVKEWSEKEVKKFIESTNKMLSVLKRHPEMCRPSSKRKYVRLGVLSKHTQLIYYYKPGEKQVTVLLFWNFKQNPQKLKY